MNLVVALHGNPGSPADYDLLKGFLPRGPEVEFLAASRPVEGAAVEVVARALAARIRERSPERLVVMGFSWGAYLACRLCLLEDIHPDRLVLLNPFLVDPSPLPRWVRCARGIPVVSPWLFRLISRRREAFVKKMFLPALPPPELRRALVARLSGPELWKGALRYKQEQDGKPLGKLSTALCGRLVVIRGECDAIAAWPLQRDLLAEFESSGMMDVHVIPGAGHSLLWTHGAEVGRLVSEETREGPS